MPTYTSAPLDAPIEILGMPELVVQVSADMPVATLVVRLSDVAPDGTSVQVTAGILNLTHRRSHTAPEPLTPASRRDRPHPAPSRRLPLRRRAPGPHLRGLGRWPVIWPSPYPGTHHDPPWGDPRRRRLPAWSCRSRRRTTTPPSPPSGRSRHELDEIGGGTSDPPAWRVTEDVLAGTVTVSTHDGGDTVLPDGTRLYSAESHDMTASDADPARARMASRIRYVLERDGHRIEVDVDGDTTSTVEAFDLDIRLGRPPRRRAVPSSPNPESIPRDLV